MELRRYHTDGWRANSRQQDNTIHKRFVIRFTQAFISTRLHILTTPLAVRRPALHLRLAVSFSRGLQGTRPSRERTLIIYRHPSCDPYRERAHCCERGGCFGDHDAGDSPTQPCSRMAGSACAAPQPQVAHHAAEDCSCWPARPCCADSHGSPPGACACMRCSTMSHQSAMTACCDCPHAQSLIRMRSKTCLGTPGALMSSYCHGANLAPEIRVVAAAAAAAYGCRRNQPLHGYASSRRCGSRRWRGGAYTGVSGQAALSGRNQRAAVAHSPALTVARNPLHTPSTCKLRSQRFRTTQRSLQQLFGSKPHAHRPRTSTVLQWHSLPPTHQPPRYHTLHSQQPQTPMPPKPTSAGRWASTTT